jgi:hypothetical protein
VGCCDHAHRRCAESSLKPVRKGDGILFICSYVLVYVIVLLEGLVIVRVLKDVAGWISESKQEEMNPAVMTKKVNFSLPMLYTDKLFSPSAYMGSSATLVFVSPQDSSSNLYENFSSVLHALWHKSNGRLHVICRGTKASCSRMANDNRIIGFIDHRVGVAVDESGDTFEMFLVNETPLALELDDEANVKRYGRPELLETIRPPFVGRFEYET